MEPVEAASPLVLDGLGTLEVQPPLAGLNRNAHPALRAPVVVSVDSDGSAINDAALAYAGEQARAFGVELLLVRPWTPTATSQVEHEAQVLAESMAHARASFPNVPVSGRLVQGFPDVVLLGEAASAQLLVVGVPARPRPGSELRARDKVLVAHSPCRVALVWRVDNADIARGGPAATSVRWLRAEGSRR